jgi:hypothetical protein
MTITKDDLLEMIGDLSLNQDDIYAKLEALQGTTVKKRTTVVEQNGINFVVRPEDGELYLRVFSSEDYTGTMEGRRQSLNRINNALGAWVSKPGFTIIQPISSCPVGNGILFTLIIGVTRTHYSQEDFKLPQ